MCRRASNNFRIGLLLAYSNIANTRRSIMLIQNSYTGLNCYTKGTAREQSQRLLIAVSNVIARQSRPCTNRHINLQMVLAESIAGRYCNMISMSVAETRGDG